ncbi:MAG: hypothetical protein ACTSSE_16410 [Candidatus Thorarchaeota archaeon]
MENESPEPQYNYDPYQQRSDCKKTQVYCIVSIALLIASGAVTHPDVVAVLPGGANTSSILSFLIIVLVLLLCFWQRPKK